ncbi:MAG TPA: CHAT domain-containing tetratricopeptide repeat protein [Myxococcaceae bacterium]|jgi:CHAT domain-containing protein/Tfp pilus assembly protein PilF
MGPALRRTWAAVLYLSLAGTAPDAGVDPRRGEAASAYGEAVKLKDAGKIADAIPKAERALALWEGLPGGAPEETARCLTTLGDLYRRTSDLARAEAALQRALAIREKTFGKDHVDVATTLTNLAIVRAVQGRFDQSAALFQRGLEIREKALGPSHPDVAASLNGLANIHNLLAEYGLAAPLYERALAIDEAALGPTHATVGLIVNNLAVVYMELGEYSRAEPLYQRALEVRETSLGKVHPDVAQSLNNLAVLYKRQGQYARAEALYQRAIAIKEETLGKSSEGVAGELNNLGICYEEQGRYDLAEPLYQRALAIREAVLDPASSDIGTTLVNLGNLYLAQGRYALAGPLYQRALASFESGVGKTHPLVAHALNDLAILHMEQGDFDRANQEEEHALAIREAVLGKAHPVVAESLNNLGRLRLRQRRPTEATPLFARALAISEERLRREALDFSESRLETFLRYLAEDEQRLDALAHAHPDDPDVRRLALAAALLFKGRSVEEASGTSRAINRALGPQEQERFEQLRGLRTRLAKLSLQGPGRADPETYQRNLKALTDEGDALEAELAKRSAPLRALTALPRPDAIVERVASALPPDAVLVEVVLYGDRPLVPRPGIPEEKLPVEARYLALVLHPDGRTGAVDLGPAKPINAAASRLRDALASQDAAYRAAARRLHGLAFKPLAPLIGGARKLLLALDGQLALVPFAALHDGRRFLTDAYDFTYLTSGRDLLPRSADEARPSAIVVFADPDYTGAGAAPAAARERSAPVERFFTQRRDLRERRWTPLPGTRAEAGGIQKLFPQAQVFAGPEASKDRLLKLAAPDILHVATHGFFLEDAPTPTGGRGLGVVGPAGAVAPRPADPLLRSGLVLAGDPEDPPSAMATALELAGLDLWGTELVVLSACDTGRGEVRRGQGVYGLRRALVVAGAETVVVSLWRVDDETTRTMMEQYYRNLLAG